MNRLLTLTLAAIAGATLVAADFADARRMGGGKSLGAQRSAPAPQQATPPASAPSQAAPTGPAANPVMPRQGAAAPAAAPAAAAKAAPGAAAPASGMSRWLGPVAGLAAGLGLAALASHLGIAEELMSVLLLVGIALLAFVAIRMFLSRRAPARPAMQYAGGPIGGTTAPRGYETQVPPAAYEAPVGGGAPSAAPVRDADAPLRPNVPVGFDAEGFAREAKSQFARLQAAFDRGDRSLLADVMTPTMFAEVARDLPAASGHPTEIVALSAEVLEAVTEGDQHWASVRFRGLLREDGEPMPKPFDEVWNLVKPADGSSGWLLAGIQQLDEAPVGHA